MFKIVFAGDEIINESTHSSSTSHTSLTVPIISSATSSKIVSESFKLTTTIKLKQFTICAFSSTVITTTTTTTSTTSNLISTTPLEIGYRSSWYLSFKIEYLS
jgi:hypothetical protein